MMMFNNLNEIELCGFKGFKTIDFLIKNFNVIPDNKGIYLVINKEHDKSFLNTSIGGHFKGKNPTVTIEKLNQNWVEDTIVIYIGKAGGFNSKANLKKRLMQYLRFGNGESVGHWGGRFIWQLENNNDLIIAWKELHDEDPREEEKKLLIEFERQYNKLPFANLVR